MPTSLPYTAASGPLASVSPQELLGRALQTHSSGVGGTPEAWTPPTIDELAAWLPAYHIHHLIGRGGMGAVYKGLQISLNRLVAIKLLPAELAGSSDFNLRFEREAQTLAQLQHPGIVAVHDFGRTAAGHLYFTMEFIHGTDLEQIIRGPGLQPEQALELTLQICEALQYAHSSGVIHRDIKPSNVLVTRDGRAKLADFGLARPIATSSGVTAASMIMGTPAYMAPEQWAGKADHRADIYALGVMLYEMLTGSRPQGAFDLPSIRSHVDARLDDVVVKAMRQAPEQRYQKVSELRDEVQHIRTTAQLPAPAKTSQSTTTAGAGKRRHGRSSMDTFGWAAAILLLIIFTIAVVWGMRQRQEGDASVAAAEVSAPVPVLPVVPETEAPVRKPEPAPMPVQPPAPKSETVTPSPAPVAVARPIIQAPAATVAAPSVLPPQAASVPVLPAPAPSVTVIDVFTREAQNILAWALAPMEADIPPDIRQNLIFIREDLVDEGKSKPAASIDAYREAYYLCEELLAALNQREQTRVAAGFRAAQSAASQPIGSQALDARRNYMMSWPQFDREQSMRAAFNQQIQARSAVSNEAQKVAWAAKSARLRTALDTRYRTFRSAMRR